MNKIFCWFRNDILKTINYKKKIFPAVVINILCTHQSAATHKVSFQEWSLFLHEVLTKTFEGFGSHYIDLFIFYKKSLVNIRSMLWVSRQPYSGQNWSYFFKNEPLISCPFLLSKLDSPVIKTLEGHSLNVKKSVPPMFWL